MVGAAEHLSVAVPDSSRLDELIARYLSAAVPVHREDSTVEMVVDGRAWMLRMRALLGTVGGGDPAYIGGRRRGRDMALPAGPPPERGFEPLGALLADLAAA